MDPISQFFAAYLQMASSNATNAYKDTANLNVTAQTLIYKDSEISFQHQLWRIKQESVCAELKPQATTYSKCSQQAKAMFTDLCNQLSSMKNLNPKGHSLSRMYCNASLNFTPMIATISKPSLKTEQQLKEQKCNLLILKTMQDSSPEIAKAKNAACADLK